MWVGMFFIFKILLTAGNGIKVATLTANLFWPQNGMAELDLFFCDCLNVYNDQIALSKSFICVYIAVVFLSLELV